MSNRCGTLPGHQDRAPTVAVSYKRRFVETGAFEHCGDTEGGTAKRTIAAIDSSQRDLKGCPACDREIDRPLLLLRGRQRRRLRAQSPPTDRSSATDRAFSDLAEIFRKIGALSHGMLHNRSSARGSALRAERLPAGVTGASHRGREIGFNACWHVRAAWLLGGACADIDESSV